MSKTIIHVDDDPDIINFVQKILAPAGYNIKSHQTMELFFKTVDEGVIVPDLFILDVMVDEVDSGIIAYSRVRERYPQVPIVLLTSLGEMIRQYFDNDLKFVWILEKPVLPDKLLSVIKSRIG